MNIIHRDGKFVSCKLEDHTKTHTQMDWALPCWSEWYLLSIIGSDQTHMPELSKERKGTAGSSTVPHGIFSRWEESSPGCLTKSEL